MNRTQRIALLAAAVLLLVAVGTVMANRAPAALDAPAAPASSHEPEAQDEADAPPTEEELAHAADRLTANEIPFTDAELSDLATRYGIGGAVRLLALADAEEVDVEVIASMRDGTDTEPGMGWGRIARELGQHPGIGSIMGNGHGRQDAPGQQKNAPEE
jgi:nucleotide-binding universal stress UspA family protein